MTDTSQDAVKMHLHRLETRGGATDRAEAADIIRALAAERDKWRDSSNRMTEFYEHRGQLLEQEHSRANKAEAERDALRAAIRSALCEYDHSREDAAEVRQEMGRILMAADNSISDQKTAV